MNECDDGIAICSCDGLEVFGCYYECVNEIGDYTCECFFGFTLDIDRRTCIGEGKMGKNKQNKAKNPSSTKYL